MKGKKIAGLVAILYMLVLVLCSSTLFWQGAVPELFAKITKTVSFEAGAFKTDSSQLTVSLREGETALLSKFTRLQSADLRGSENLEEVHAWAESNPQVQVCYEVPMPDGSVVLNSATHLDFSDINEDNYEAYINCLRYLKNVQQIDLGDEAQKSAQLSLDRIKALRDSFPDIRFEYDMLLMGQSYSIYTESLDLSGLKPEETEQALGCMEMMSSLKSVELGSQAQGQLGWHEIGMLLEKRPDVNFSYSFELYGKSFTLADEIVDLSYCPVDDGGEAVCAALKGMKNCKTLDMDSCGLTDDVMARIAQENPDVDVIWRIWFGKLYSVRTDAERILASKPSDGGVVDNEHCAKLRYCTRMKYLDLGHNEAISDLSFVESMPELEVLIIAMNPISDLSPLAKCPKLEYLEINTTAVTDLSPLAQSKALRHLNIGKCPYLTDISPLYGLTELERLWIGSLTPIPAEQEQQMHALAPNCTISTASADPHGDGWRNLSYNINTDTYVRAPRYELLRKQLGYDYQEYSFYWLDPKCRIPAPPELAGKYYIHEDQLNGLA